VRPTLHLTAVTHHAGQFLARCLEVEGLTARGASVHAAVAALTELAAHELADCDPFPPTCARPGARGATSAPGAATMTSTTCADCGHDEPVRCIRWEAVSSQTRPASRSERSSRLRDTTPVTCGTTEWQL
jgi:hypothetical protein